MTRTSLIALIAIVALAGACAFQNLNRSQKADLAIASLDVVVKPECVRLDEIKDLDPEAKATVVEFCFEVVDDVKAAIKAGVTEDAALMCPRIAEKADECADLAGLLSDDPQKQLRNTATCERLIGAANLACVAGTAEPAPAE